MVKIRLMRVGKRKQPSYRVVVADERSPRDGRIIEAIGHYQPRREPSEVRIDIERAEYWLGVGAQPTSAVRRLLDIAHGAVEPIAEPQKKATAAASVQATAAASVDEPEQSAAEGEADQAGDPEGVAKESETQEP